MALEIPPPIRYTERDGGSIAFEEIGTGGGRGDVILFSDPPSHLDLLWTDSGYVDILLRLAHEHRVIFYDRRGTGLSDPLDEPPTLESQALDLEAVMDAAGSPRASLLGYGGSCMIAAYFAATRPERTDRLAMTSPWDRPWSEPGGGWEPGQPEEAMAKLTNALDHWGEGQMLGFAAPALDNSRNRRLFGMLERASASRAQVRATFEAALELDISSLLPSIQAPTLVVQHADIAMPAAVCARVAEQIPGAEFVEVDYRGEPHVMADFWHPIVDELSTWMTGEAHSREQGNRTVASLLFTDIVGSTAHAARLGDAAWRAILVRHDEILDEAVELEGGRVVKHIGDGSLSVFDGPVAAIRAAARAIETASELGVEIRTGVHTGECERVGLDVAGIAVHVGARVEAAAAPNEILVTAAAMELCGGSGLDFVSRGDRKLKGVPGEWELFALTGSTEPVAVPSERRPLRAADRALLSTARRAPALLRAAGRLTNRRRR